jgi:hypothetical protein
MDPSTTANVALAGLGLSALAVLVAAITLGFVWYAHRVERRRWPAVMWAFDRYGDGTFNGERVYFCELVQFGPGPARLAALPMLVGGEFVQDEEHRLRQHFSGPDSQKLMLRTEDPGSVWILLTEMRLDDRRWLWVSWEPLSNPGPALLAAMEVQAAESARHRRPLAGLRWRLTRRWRGPSPVGPGGAQAARLRGSSRHMSAEIETALSLAVVAHEVVDTRRGVREG